MSQELIKLEKICKSFPGVNALQDVDFRLRGGEVVALCGANGAGKSTMSNIIAGIYSHDSGNIIIDGKEVKINSSKCAENFGIGIVHQEPTLVPRMTIVENIFLGKEIMRGKLFLNFDKMKKMAEETLAKLGFSMDVNTRVAKLPLVEREAVEIAKAVLLNPRILILDEVTAPLNQVEVKHVFEVIKSLQKQDIGIIFISHKLNECIEISDRVVVLRDGRNAAELVVTPDITEKHIISPMLGTTLEQQTGNDVQESKEPEFKEELLKVSNLNRKGNFSDISFTLHKGEIIGFAGLKGAGITELFSALQGTIPYDSGEILVNGAKTKHNTPYGGINAGIGMVTHDRHKEGLALHLDVKSNIAISSYSNCLKGFGFIDNKKVKESSGYYVKKLEIKTPSLTQKVQNLSGGNQQKIVIAKWLLRNLNIIIVDEPTRGVDVKAKSEIYKLLIQQKALGKGILAFSPECRELLEISDRILIVVNGRIVDEVKRNSPRFNEPSLLEIIHATRQNMHSA